MCSFHTPILTNNPLFREPPLAYLTPPKLPPTKTHTQKVGEVLRHSYRVGLSGGGATLLSVASMMWLHTIVTYQQRHGTPFAKTARHLWKVGGPGRFYRGFLPSLAVAPICRFGDTLSNELAVTLLQADPQGGGGGDWVGGGRVGGAGAGLPVWMATFVGSFGAAVFHAAVVPLDTYKVRVCWCWWCFVVIFVVMLFMRRVPSTGAGDEVAMATYGGYGDGPSAVVPCWGCIPTPIDGGRLS